MKKIILTLVAIAAITGIVLAIPRGGSSIYAIKPITYPDRDGVSYRLSATDQGVVLAYGHAPGGSDINGARDIFVYPEAGKYYMTYDGAGTTSWESNEAVSTDLTHWTELGAILNHGVPGSMDAASDDYGTIYKNGNHYDMFYLGTPNQSGAPANVPAPPYYTMEARSDSPTGPWTKVSTIPFTTKPDSYYTDTVSPGPIVKNGNQYLMFFSAGNGKRTISIARTTDVEGSWTIDAQPILPNTEQLENASLYYQASDKTWFMFADHVGVDKNGIEYTDAIWVYWTHDLNSWSTARKAVVVDGSVSTWSKQIIGLPSVVPVGNKLAVFYDGRAAGQDYVHPDNSHTQRSVGLAWVKLPIKTLAGAQ